MHRFYLPPDQTQGPVLSLSGGDAHHAAHVLRLKPGDRAVVLDGAGHELLCRIRQLGRHEARLEVCHRTTHPVLPYQLCLFQAVPKGKAMEMIVQKATELGVWRIIPLLSERTVAQFEADQAGHKAGRWQQTAMEAIKQCGSPWLPRIETPVDVSAALGRRERFDLSFVGSLQAEARHPRSYFEAYFLERGRGPNSLAVWIGPEGDFTPAELSQIRAGGALPITLGRLVLRSETAAIYCLSILSYELQARA